MLKLLLDEHLSPRIAQQVRSKWTGGQIESVLFWQSGQFAGVPDDLLLTEAHAKDGPWLRATSPPSFRS